MTHMGLLSSHACVGYTNSTFVSRTNFDFQICRTTILQKTWRSMQNLYFKNCIAVPGYLEYRTRSSWFSSYCTTSSKIIGSFAVFINWNGKWTCVGRNVLEEWRPGLVGKARTVQGNAFRWLYFDKVHSNQVLKQTNVLIAFGLSCWVLLRLVLHSWI